MFLKAFKRQISCPNKITHTEFSRTQWRHYRANNKLSISEYELSPLRGFNEKISTEEVEDIYLPLCNLININKQCAQIQAQHTAQFLGQPYSQEPFVISISGSVAVGKSTTARIVQHILAHWGNKQRVDLITTDGFLYPNKYLSERNLMQKKGFPESYNLNHLVHTIIAAKANSGLLTLPMYSHERYDIAENCMQFINNPDILILEGLNVINTAVRDLVDFAIYLDADTSVIKNWYLSRFMTFRKQALNQPDRYFHRFAKISEIEARNYARDIWKDINEVNLDENILPYKNKANVILHKSPSHSITKVKLRKF